MRHLLLSISSLVTLLLATSAARADHLDDVPRQEVPGLPHVNGILDYSPFQLVGHFGSEDEFRVGSGFWADLSGYVYDGPDNPAYNGKTFAYVGTRTSSEGGNLNGVVVFDITDASNPAVVGKFRPPGSGHLLDIDIHDGIGYVSSNSGDGFWIMDVRANPIDPVAMSHTSIGGVHTLDVDVTDDGVFLYAASGGTQVYNVTDPANPSFLTTINVSTHDGHAENGRYYVHGSSRTSIYDVSDIKNGNATFLGAFGNGPGENDGGSHSGRPSSDGSAYYIGHEGGLLNLHVLDIRDPANPTLVKSISNDDVQAPFTPDSGADMLGQSAHQQFVMGDLLFNSWGPAGMTVHDITNPFDPVLVGTFDTEADSNNGGCCSEGAFSIYPLLGLDRVLISDRNNGFWIVDLTGEPLSRLPVEASAIYAVIDNNSDGVFDDLGDVVLDVAAQNRSQVGEVDSIGTNKMNRLVAKFELPDAPTGKPVLARATLRFFLDDIVGEPAGPLSLRHSITDNDLTLLASDFENVSYVDTSLDLIQSSDTGGRFYELDVTDLVLADYAADGLNPQSAFRLEVSEAIFLDDEQSNRYRLRMPGSAANQPELALSFIELLATAISELLIDSPPLALAFDGDVEITAGAQVDVTPGYTQASATLETIVAVTHSGTLTGLFAGEGEHLRDGIFVDTITYNAHDVTVDILQAAPGDLNGDRQVDVTDIQLILAANSFNNPAGGPYTWLEGDNNGDGLVNSTDIQNILATNFFGADAYAALPGRVAVPEPSSLALALIALVLASTRRRPRPFCYVE